MFLMVPPKDRFAHPECYQTLFLNINFSLIIGEKSYHLIVGIRSNVFEDMPHAICH